MMKNKKRLNYVNDFLKEKFGARVLKIGIDGGFTCPNRDGTKGFGGCLFCSERGSGEHLLSLSIKEQLAHYFDSYRSSRADLLILYFQNFSNTYDSLEHLKEKYDTAIFSAREEIQKRGLAKKIVGLSIATRPDCINEEIAKLLASYTDALFVTVELGLQTACDETKKQLNMGYTNADFIKAVHLLHEYGISVCAHIMIGLPGEGHLELVDTTKFINSLPLQGIKIHSTYVVKNSLLARLYEEKRYTPLTLEEYLDEVLYVISHLSEEIVIHRISGDAPKELLLAPEWNRHKKWVLNGVMRELEMRDLWQGKFF